MKIGLALSGGGFRATLYHLGLVRFLYEAGLLSKVACITSVSGGSIIAAHLGLNWDRYTGSTNEFNEAASELLAFIRLDVRNRILRRYLLAFPLRAARKAAGYSNRQLTRPGLLEYHYEKYLYGDMSLFQLPECPSLHILATDISEGRLCSFSRDGLWMIRRGEDRVIRIDRSRIGLATIPMAVAASSAFPGFFPPFVITGADVGAKGGEFGRHAYTDGGVFDNLGVRMFHSLAQGSGEDKLPWDGVLVSDAGRPFETKIGRRTGGLIRTAMRATDILMDRVWQLETETFKDTPNFAFARITEVVSPEEDPTSLHPEVQRQLSSIRTDLDRFSDIEISNLVQHGYFVGRKACRARPELFGTELPSEPAWDPTLGQFPMSSAVVTGTTAYLPQREQTAVTLMANALPASAVDRIGSTLRYCRHWLSRSVASIRAGALPGHEPTAATLTARTLNASAGRRIWSTLLDYRDWVSYIYVPIILPILFLMPYMVERYYERTHRINQIVESLAQESRDLEQMTRLMDGVTTSFVGEKGELLPLDKPDLTAFTVLQDLRIIDLRNWRPGARDSTVYGYRRLKVRKEHGLAREFRVSVLAISPNTQVRFPPQQLRPKLYSRSVAVQGRTDDVRDFKVGASFDKVPVGEPVDIIYEHLSPGLYLKSGIESTTLSYDVEVETIELSRWLLMPQGKEYRSFEMIRYPTGNPKAVESVKPVTEFRAKDFTILAFKLLALHAGYTYELTWFYR